MRRVMVKGRLSRHFFETLDAVTPVVSLHSRLVSPNTFLSSSEPVSCYFGTWSPISQSWPLFYSTHALFMRSPALRLQKEAADKLPSILEGKRCWSCGSEALPGAFLLCPSCNTVQPLDPTVDYFELFSLEKRYDLDLKELEQRYKALQKQLHPDLFGLASQEEQKYSADQSAQVIRAYHTLVPLLSRATYLLSLKGIDVEEEGTVEDLDILLEIMEMQEAVEAVTNVKDLHSLLNKAKSKISEREKSLVAAFRGNNLAAAKTSQQEMSYYDRVCRTILKKL